MTTATRGHPHRYEARIVWMGGENGTADYASYGRSYTIRIPGKPELQGSADRVFHGDPAVHNPEDLFLAAVGGCHMLAYLALCARRGVRVLEYQDHATGVLRLDRDGSGRFTQIELTPTVVVADPDTKDLALALHEVAHQECFIANSCSVPIRCRPAVQTAEQSD